MSDLDKIPNNDIVLTIDCIIDVFNNYEASSPDDELGYVTTAVVNVCQNGDIVTEGRNGVSEKINLLKVVRASNNINNYDPSYATRIRLMMSDMDITFVFENKLIKGYFWNTITELYDSLRKNL